jgi:ribonuclease HII
MTLVIGTDEAGYGPSLGPLVVAATAWRVAAAADEAEGILTEAIRAATSESAHGLVWADSKAVFRPAGRRAAGDDTPHPLGRLEHGLLVAAAILAGDVPGDWRALEAIVGPLGPEARADGGPQWESLDRAAVPLATDAGTAGRGAAVVSAALARHGVRLLAVRIRCLYPGRFNADLDRGLNKSDILSQTTLGLAAELVSSRAADAPEPLLVWCDRHGGRKRYAGVVGDAFAAVLDGALVSPIEETAARSSYRLGWRGRIEFCVGGESRPPVALASMAAKYVRERAMGCFNAFWAGREPGLRPTAGYPQDAVRWREEAREAITASGIPADQFWRRA